MAAPALTLIAAVEVSDGEVALRTKRGGVESATGFDDPVAAARAWVSQGAGWLYLADLDADGSNAELLHKVQRSVPRSVRTVRAGGICDEASLAAAEKAGFNVIVVDTSALDAPWLSKAFADHGHRVVAALDVHRGRLSAPGSSVDGADLDATIAALRAAGCKGYVVTDVDHEGTRRGPDTKLLASIGQVAGAPLCVAGGIARLEHLHDLVEMGSAGVVAAVLDAALYDDYFSFAEAVAAVEPRFDPYQWGPAQPWGMTQGL